MREEPIRILVSSPDASLRLALCSYLSGRYEIRDVAPGPALERELAHRPYDLVIAEYPPRPHGYRRSRGQDTPWFGFRGQDGWYIKTIIITDLSDQDFEVQRLERMANVLDVFPMPLDFKRIHEKIVDVFHQGAEWSRESRREPGVNTGDLSRVLVVDEDPAVCASLSTMMEEEGFQVWVSHDWRKAAEWCREQAFDFMTTEYLFSDATYEEFRELLIRQESPHPLPNVLLVSGIAEMLPAGKFRSYSEVKGALGKPASPEQVLRFAWVFAEPCLGAERLSSVAC